MLLAQSADAAPAAAPPIDDDRYRVVNLAIAKHHALPRYTALSEAATRFKTEVRSLCLGKPPRDLTKAKQAFHDTMDRWMSVAHIHEGPILLLMRQPRIFYWPDRRGRGSRQLRDMIAGRNEDVLAPDRFPDLSIAVQGLPAAERLMFEEDYAASLSAGTEEDYPCKLLAAVARNVADMAAELAAEWRDGPGTFPAEIRDAGSETSRFGSHREVTAAFVKGLYTTLQIVTDAKLDRVLGKKPGHAQSKRAESWRSGRSLANIVENLAALRSLYEGGTWPGLKSLLGPDQAELAALMTTAFQTCLETARSIGRPLAEAVTDTQARKQVETLALQVRALKDLVSTRLAPALHTPLGFNALDGD